MDRRPRCHSILGKHGGTQLTVDHGRAYDQNGRRDQHGGLRAHNLSGSEQSTTRWVIRRRYCEPGPSVRSRSLRGGSSIGGPTGPRSPGVWRTARRLYPTTCHAQPRYSMAESSAPEVVTVWVSQVSILARRTANTIITASMASSANFQRSYPAIASSGSPATPPRRGERTVGTSSADASRARRRGRASGGP